MTEERAYWLAWCQISGIGPIILTRLEQHFGNLADAWHAIPQDLKQVQGIGSQTIEKIIDIRSRLDPQQFYEEHIKKNPCFWTPRDRDYPRLLLEIPNPPPILYYRGQVDPQENQGIKPSIGIVGTRHPSDYGKRWTKRISTALTKSGFTIVSGLAAGIDTEAHFGCLNAGGRTIAVFGTGVDLVYPRENKKLAEAILEQGLIISEYPAGTKGFKTHFPRRNRIITGLSRALLVMEAPQKSGALITADYAKEFHRDIYVLTARLDDDNSQGCLELLNQGATPIPPNRDRLLSEERLLKMLGALPQLDTTERGEQLSLFTQTPAPRLPQLEPRLTQVLDAIQGEATPFDLIVETTQLPPGEVSSVLLELELLEIITQLPGMRYQRC